MFYKKITNIEITKKSVQKFKALHSAWTRGKRRGRFHSPLFVSPAENVLLLTNFRNFGLHQEQALDKLENIRCPLYFILYRFCGIRREIIVHGLRIIPYLIFLLITSTSIDFIKASEDKRISLTNIHRAMFQTFTRAIGRATNTRSFLNMEAWIPCPLCPWTPRLNKLVLQATLNCSNHPSLNEDRRWFETDLKEQRKLLTL